MKIFLKSRFTFPVLFFICAPLSAANSDKISAEEISQSDFQGQFESNDISSSGRWILEFKFENGQWSGRANVSNGHWAKLEDVKVNGNIIEFYLNSKPITKFKAKIDAKNLLISGMQEIGNGKKNKMNNIFLPFTANRI
jgi:hypothetical protein